MPQHSEKKKKKRSASCHTGCGGLRVFRCLAMVQWSTLPYYHYYHIIIPCIINNQIFGSVKHRCRLPFTLDELVCCDLVSVICFVFFYYCLNMVNLSQHTLLRLSFKIVLKCFALQRWTITVCRNTMFEFGQISQQQ